MVLLKYGVLILLIGKEPQFYSVVSLILMAGAQVLATVVIGLAMKVVLVELQSIFLRQFLVGFIIVVMILVLLEITLKLGCNDLKVYFL